MLFDVNTEIIKALLMLVVLIETYISIKKGRENGLKVVLSIFSIIFYALDYVKILSVLHFVFFLYCTFTLDLGSKKILKHLFNAVKIALYYQLINYVELKEISTYLIYLSLVLLFFKDGFEISKRILISQIVLMVGPVGSVLFYAINSIFLFWDNFNFVQMYVKGIVLISLFYLYDRISLEPFYLILVLLYLSYNYYKFQAMSVKNEI